MCTHLPFKYKVHLRNPAVRLLRRDVTAKTPALFSTALDGLRCSRDLPAKNPFAAAACSNLYSNSNIAYAS